ncbi:alpha/beta fold hydrolase [Parasulfuritortus cantonensis]|uniref:Alpha/beta fold hydrolase n=1 Tax=Parasulfuritortus cantonensis TaxID=2528202 RepID=A0A4R1B6K5_9PROT|nr:alpha/beta fold hydrolase [Parasulfuritortus cantonensis]TCJ12337.1 alpha/beta fold hydrolase [Parasulfuritortus cantonensis]
MHSTAMPPYRAPAWLPGGDLQTIWAVAVPRPPVAYRRERWELPDGDFIDLDWLDGPAGAPLVVLFHGLEGSSDSHYARFLMAALAGRGWRGVVAHFRGCSGEVNRLARAYHSGDSAEIERILTRLHADAAGAPLHAVGVSLGGNALLKWLGERGADAARWLGRAAAVSAPLDLPAAGATLDRGFGRVYGLRFLGTLKEKARAKLGRHPLPYDRAALARVNTLHAFDSVVTAPLHGFRDADDYWTRCASKPYLKGIGLPTLVLNARNDPFMPAASLPGADAVAACVTLDFPDQGGHVGFLSGPPPGNQDWLTGRLLAFLGADAGAGPRL